MQAEPYLLFNGNCESALEFYTKIFDGTVTQLKRYDRTPFSPQLPPERRQQVMHARFRAPEIRFMASDKFEGYPADSRISLSLETHDEGEASRLFNALAEGGTVDMALSPAPWGGMFGMLTDRFGIDWLVSCADDFE